MHPGYSYLTHFKISPIWPKWYKSWCNNPATKYSRVKSLLSSCSLRKASFLLSSKFISCCWLCLKFVYNCCQPVCCNCFRCLQFSGLSVNKHSFSWIISQAMENFLSLFCYMRYNFRYWMIMIRRLSKCLNFKKIIQFFTERFIEPWMTIENLAKLLYIRIDTGCDYLILK